MGPPSCRLFNGQPCEGTFKVAEGPELIASIRCAELKKCAAVKIVFRTVEKGDPMLTRHTKRTQIVCQRPNIDRAGARTGLSAVDEDVMDVIARADGQQFFQQRAARMEIDHAGDICSQKLLDRNYSHIIRH